MPATENATRLLTRITLIARATDEALEAAAALAAEVGGAGTSGRPVAGAPPGGDAGWLPGIAGALRRIQLECADLTFAMRALRDALPSPDTLQPRLLD